AKTCRTSRRPPVPTEELHRGTVAGSTGTVSAFTDGGFLDHGTPSETWAVSQGDGTRRECPRVPASPRTSTRLVPARPRRDNRTDNNTAALLQGFYREAP